VLGVQIVHTRIEYLTYSIALSSKAPHFGHQLIFTFIYSCMINRTFAQVIYILEYTFRSSEGKCKIVLKSVKSKKLHVWYTFLLRSLFIHNLG